MLKLIMTKFILSIILFAAVFFSVSCSFSVTPVYNSKNGTNQETGKGQVKDVKNRDDLKTKAIEKVKQLHKLMEERKFEEAYQMIDGNSSLKHPKAEALNNLQEVVDALGKVEKMDLTRDSVVEDRSVNNGQLQVRQEFVVKFEKDTPSPKRYEIFIWNVYPNDEFKLWTYINSKGEE
jgi:PBP1b-binding outer membrane lipoprotein LpoB